MNTRIACLMVANVAALIGLQSAVSQGATASANSQGDQSNRPLTADDQREDAADLQLTRRIRQQVMAAKGLSTAAQNVTIVSANGQVTLNGTVRNRDEKRRVAALAAQVAGRRHVVNDLQVAPPAS